MQVKRCPSGPLRAIMRHCLWCMNGNVKFIKECEHNDCSLWEYRFGVDKSKADYKKLERENVVKS